MTNYSYLRINANTDIPQVFVNLDDIKKGEEFENLRPLFSHSTDYTYKEDLFLGRSKYSMWCSDGKRYNVQIYYDTEGLEKGLLPNHRVNAMIDAGRFTSKKFDYIGKTRNQDIKETWGSNYFMGDVIIRLTTGKPIPDCAIYGENPLKFLMDIKKPNRRMINKYGEEASLMMIHPFYTKKMPTGLVTSDDWENADWEKEDYHIIPRRCENTEYFELLKSWGLQPLQ